MNYLQNCAMRLRNTTSIARIVPPIFVHPPDLSMRPGGNLSSILLVIAYQNVVVYPHFRSEIAELKAPEILPQVSLVGGNSRGGQIPVAAVGSGRPFLLLVDIPAEDRFSSYTCLLYSPSGSLAWRVDVSAQQAKDTVSIRVPGADRGLGEYSLTVQGNMAGSAVDLAHDRFSLSSHD
jgi:hypothetical protein